LEKLIREADVLNSAVRPGCRSDCETFSDLRSNTKRTAWSSRTITLRANAAQANAILRPHTCDHREGTRRGADRSSDRDPRCSLLDASRRRFV